jgi:protein farnesyltransferase subunit beta
MHTHPSLFHLEALQGFILVSSQADAGGLRDKPGRPADAYHTLYNLSGLSSAQHHVYRPVDRRESVKEKWVEKQRSVSLGAAGSEEKETRKSAFEGSMSWAEEEGASRYVGGKANRVVSHHSTLSHRFPWYKPSMS